MQVRYQAPTEAFPFFHGVKVSTSKGWRRVMMRNACDDVVPAYFPSYDRAIKAARWTRKQVEAGA